MKCYLSTLSCQRLIETDTDSSLYEDFTLTVKSVTPRDFQLEKEQTSLFLCYTMNLLPNHFFFLLQLRIIYIYISNKIEWQRLFISQVRYFKPSKFLQKYWDIQKMFAIVIFYFLYKYLWNFLFLSRPKLNSKNIFVYNRILFFFFIIFFFPTLLVIILTKGFRGYKKYHLRIIQTTQASSFLFSFFFNLRKISFNNK